MLLWTGLNTLAVEAVPENRGGATSVFGAFRFAGSALSPYVFLPIYNDAPVARIRGLCGGRVRDRAARDRDPHALGRAGPRPRRYPSTPMSDCIFCGIAAGTMPAERVYEDERTVAFLDIFPACDGHLLVIPRAHADNVHAADPADVAASTSRPARRMGFGRRTGISARASVAPTVRPR